MKFGNIKLEEFLNVTLTATLVVIGIRVLFFYGGGTPWVQQVIDRSQPTVARDGGSIPPVNTPNSIVDANRSVVMLEGNRSLGSGVILTSDGLVLTNSHVIRNGSGQWRARLYNDQELPVRIIAVGSREAGIHYDLALVQIEGAANLPAAQFSDNLPQMGEPVWAIGAPYGKAEVVTQGELKRISKGVLLTNTEVHPGNSGGPLLNQQGEVIGINTEISLNQPDNATTASISVATLEEYLPKIMNNR
ncbi:MAG: S1C family serine protease [Elainella sp.]